MAFKVQNIFIHCAVALCIVFFLLLMTDTINKFSQKMTSIGVIIKESHSQTKILPCVTICPWRPFKSLGFHFNADNFSRSTFEKKEIFFNSSKYNAINTIFYTLEEIRSIFFGRCYKIDFLKPQRRMEAIYIPLKNANDYKGICLDVSGLVRSLISFYTYFNYLKNKTC